MLLRTSALILSKPSALLFFALVTAFLTSDREFSSPDTNWGESFGEWRQNHWIADYDDQNYVVPLPAVIQMIEYLMHINKGEDRTVAKAIAKKVRVFCLVMTLRRRHNNRSRIINETWGKRCDKLLFMSTKSDKSLPAIAMTKRGDHHWHRDKEAFEHVYLNHRHDADWFLRTDDDTYVIMENLKYMLKNHSSTEAVYFGCMPEDSLVEGLSLNAGFVFSKQALIIFGEKANSCESTSDRTNIVMEKCLHSLNIKMSDSRDSEGRGRFFPYSPPYLSLSSSGAADYAITFHKITNNYLYLMEFFVYHLRAFGIVAKYEATDKDE